MECECKMSKYRPSGPRSCEWLLVEFFIPLLLMLLLKLVLLLLVSFLSVDSCFDRTVRKYFNCVDNKIMLVEWQIYTRPFLLTKSPLGTNSMIIIKGCSKVQKPRSLTTFGCFPTRFIVEISPRNSSSWSVVGHSLNRTNG